MFDVRADMPSRMLRITLSGFWDMPTMDRYMAAVREEMGRLKAAGAFGHVLIDMTDYPIQQSAVAEAHAANLIAVRRMNDVKVALVIQNGLSKLQAARVAADTGHETFPNEEEAVDWLLGREGARG